MTKADQDEIVAEILSWIGGTGVWTHRRVIVWVQLIKHMESAGWSEDEVSSAIQAFGGHVGRDDL